MMTSENRSGAAGSGNSHPFQSVMSSRAMNWNLQSVNEGKNILNKITDEKGAKKQKSIREFEKMCVTAAAVQHRGNFVALNNFFKYRKN